MELRWNSSFSASCLHAAAAVYDGRRLSDERLAEALAQPVASLAKSMATWDLPVGRLWRHLNPLSATVDSNTALAEGAIRKAVGNVPAGAVSEIAGGISEIENAVRQSFPKLVEELSLRIKPLREHWEARGPGLLRSIVRLTDERVLVSNAEVIVVHPAIGGAGVAHLIYNSIRIEGLLANPIVQLPETLRLGWLLAQLNSDLPVFSDAIHGDRLSAVAEMAFLAVVIKAAEDVEWAEFSSDNIQLALDAWHVSVPDDRDPVEAIMEWWGVFSESPTRWDVALAALDRLLYE